MERLTYMLVIGLICCFCFLALIKPTNSTQSGLGLGGGLQQLSQNGRDIRRDVDALDVHKRAQPGDSGVPDPPPAAATTKTPPTTKPSPTQNVNGSSPENSDKKGYGRGFIDGFASPDTLKRMLGILLAITAIAVIYFVYRTIRLRRNRKTRKYGVLTTNSDHLEMAPLDQEEEDEDMTVFEANSR